MSEPGNPVAEAVVILDEQNTKLKAHAELTVKFIERFKKNRRGYKGLKDWERKLLTSAYKALGVQPPAPPK